MPVDFKSAFHNLQHLLRQGGSLRHLRATFDQHRKFITAQPGHSKAFAKHALQTIRDGLEQQVTHVMAEAVIDDFEMIQIDHQQRAARL